MDAKLMKIQISPAKYCNDGELAKYESAQLTFDVPLDSGGQRADIICLLDMLKGDVRLTIEKTQYTFAKDLMPIFNPDELEDARLNAEKTQYTVGKTGIYDPGDELEELAAQGKIQLGGLR